MKFDCISILMFARMRFCRYRNIVIYYFYGRRINYSTRDIRPVK